MNEIAMLWTGRLLSGVFVLFMLGASIAPKLFGIPVAEVTLADLGWRSGQAFKIGLIELGCVVLYLVPRTSVFGATLMMAVLGGAIASQWRIGASVFSHTLFGVYIGLLMWGGLWLRDPALRSLFPFRMF